MFNWGLFLVLVLACVPGVLVIVPGAISTIEETARTRLPEGKKLPQRGVMLTGVVVQTLVFVAIAAAAGTALAPRVGLGAPVFEALVAGKPIWPALQPQLLPALGISAAGAIVLIAAYYGFFRRRLDRETAQCVDALRNRIGIVGRVLYGGVVEEVLMRWGLMTVLVWLGALVAGGPSAGVVWAAILVSGLLFGAGPCARLHRSWRQAHAGVLRVIDHPQPVGGHDLRVALLAVRARGGNGRARAVPPGMVAGGRDGVRACASPRSIRARGECARAGPLTCR